jgi:hypothetical protein
MLLILAGETEEEEEKKEPSRLFSTKIMLTNRLVKSRIFYEKIHEK